MKEDCGDVESERRNRIACFHFTSQLDYELRVFGGQVLLERQCQSKGAVRIVGQLRLRDVVHYHLAIINKNDHSKGKSGAEQLISPTTLELLIKEIIIND